MAWCFEKIIHGDNDRVVGRDHRRQLRLQFCANFSTADWILCGHVTGCFRLWVIWSVNLSSSVINSLSYFRGFLLILLGIATMFWGLTIIFEEYCAPAIRIYSIRNNVAVPGSILIGAGSSLSVFFSSYVD